jgi:hypothetical protein
LSTTENVGAAKVAVTDCAALRVTLQTPVPVQAPLQPVNVDPVPATAVNATVPLANVVEQIVPQLMPAGLLVTVPAPVTETVSGNVVTALMTARKASSLPPAFVDWKALLVMGKLVDASPPVT